MLAVSSDGSTATVQQFSVSKQLLLGNPMTGIPCSTLSPVRKEDAQPSHGDIRARRFQKSLTQPQTSARPGAATTSDAAAFWFAVRLQAAPVKKVG